MFVIAAVLLIIILLYWVGTRRFDYWESKGIKYEKPYPFVGNSIDQLLLRVSLGDLFYKRYPNERFVGLYGGNKPILVVREPRDVQRVLATDFYTFYPRGIIGKNEAYDPLTQHLFLADGDLWKLLRHRMTPAFTTGKLKAMFPLIVERAEKLQALAAEEADKKDEVDVKDLMARYTTDFIGACGFGINMDALDDENSAFRVLGKRIVSATKIDMIKGILRTAIPFLAKYVTMVPGEVTSMTVSLVKKIMKDRKYQPSNRNDFIDLLLEVKQKGKMTGESIEKKNSDGTPTIVERELDDGLIAAQAFVFFLAGFETSSSTSSSTLHHLAFYQEEQKKCQKEIDIVLEKYDNKLCYDAVNDLKYLKMCFK
jgi:cytochrome P450 family 6